jgi:type II secretory pathway pseudopilin PulG
MSTRKKPKNFAQRLLRRTWRLFNTATKGLVNWVLRSLMVHRRRSRQSQAGFVLPTVVMVLLVVVLLTTAIVIRSFDRSKNASNFRVNEAVLNATTPALDRARAKLQYMFSPEENNIQGNTPTEENIEDVLKTERYTFGDETRLTLVDDSAGGTPQTLATAWKFPADTDNDGKLDSFILYGIYFRNPPIQNGNPTRARTPLEARALPQEDTGRAGKCGGEVAGGTAGWFPTSGKLKKAFFTYVASVPITEVPTTPYKGTIDTNKFQVYTGNRGFSALEMQQDLARIALDNNAVWYENDIEINATTTLRLNGRVHTNSNLMVSNPSGDNYINFLQVSSPDSCFYDPENAKIVVGGNVAAGGPGAQNSSGQYVPNTDFTNDAVKVDLYNGDDQAPDQTVINASNKTTQETPLAVASNSDAFARRLDVLVEGAMNLYKASNATNITPALVKAFARFPKEIGENFELKYDKSNAEGSLRQTIDSYFRERIRRVSYAEVPITPPEAAVYSPGTSTVLTSETTPTVAGQQFVFSGGTGVIAAPLEWMLIENPNNGSVDGYTELPLLFSGDTMELEATQPTSDEIEELIGNRVLVGNGLPNRWVDTTKAPTDEEYYAPEGKEKPVFENGTRRVNWNDSGTQRQREGRVQVLDDLGDTTRGGFWEQAAAKLNGGRFLNTAELPQVNEELAGGLRVITGAGIYVDGETTLGAAGTGKRLGDPTVTQANLITEVKSFLPVPAKPLELQANNVKIPDWTTIPNRAVNAPAATTPDDYFLVVWPDTMPMYQFVPTILCMTPLPRKAPRLNLERDSKATCK